jgi:thioredoxin-related protein
MPPRRYAARMTLRFLLPTVLAVSAMLRAEPEYPKMGPDIYDTQADGSSLISGALAQAKITHRRVLLDLGANWCIWCRRLHHTLETNPTVKPVLDKNFVLVLIDVNHRDGKSRNDTVNRFYDDPMKEGLPVLVVLEANGRQLATQETGALEDGKGGHDPKKIVAFLEKWAPKK